MEEVVDDPGDGGVKAEHQPKVETPKAATPMRESSQNLRGADFQ